MTKDNSSRWLIVVVAVPFLVGGGLAFVSALYSAPNSQPSLLLGVLNFGVGVGLLMKRPGWRGAALIVLALQLAGTIFLGAMLFSTDSPLTLGLLNRAVQLDSGLDALLLSVLSAIEVASLVILTRPSVRQAFGSHVLQAHPAGAHKVD